MSGEPDELYTLRNLFWLGNYQMAINEANGLNRIPTNLVTEKEEFVYRSYLALGQYHIILSEIRESATTPVSLRAIKLLATVLSDPFAKDTAKVQLEEWLSNPTVHLNPTLRLVSAILYIHEDNLKEAIKHVRYESNLEQCALLVQLYLRIDRVDLAQKMVKQMKAKDEDSTLAMLATAWTNLSLDGGTKAQEAAYIYEELIDKYGSSATLLNGLAVSKMQQGLHEEAETHLHEALTKAPMDPDSLANLVAVSQHLQRAEEVVGRYLGQLKTKAPTHQLVTSLATFDGAYDRVSATLKA